MTNVLLISQEGNKLTSKLADALSEKGCNVVQVTDGLDELRNIKDEFALIITYLDDIVSKRKEYVCIRDMAVLKKTPIAIIGEKEQIARGEMFLPKLLIKKKFTCPFDTEKVANEITEYLEVDKPEEKRKILVVDDSGLMLRSVKTWLEDKYEVILANSGAMAIKYLAMKRPDLVLLDYEMPICDGKQVLEMIRAESDFSDIPVVFLTNKNDKDSVMQVSSLKPEGYLLKTMEPGKIVKYIDEFFEGRE